ncbi:ATP-binding protein [Rossellomorea aquimaris]|uniref:AlbA family DNA-binding domain-containing protein n=1 Tax=Rossellomorea aquimaris TaxID=189382 RepID=UPI001CD5E357|nr:ATP-binding protein [Rossellomorea aquimaris]MCA1054514.1 ATP-binding protein [Rossellomorea aquimaris]
MFYENIVPMRLRDFLKNPSHESLKDLLLHNTGETDYVDFKSDWIEFSKLAKHVLAISNSGGGCIIIGVMQYDDGSVELKGLSDEAFLDKADVDNKLQHLLPKYLRYRTEDFIFTKDIHPLLNTKRFQVLIIDYDPRYVPYTSIVNRGELRYGAIYVRQGTKTIEANNEKLVDVILRKVQSGGSDSDERTLQEHLEHLKILQHEYDHTKDDKYKKYLYHLILRKMNRIEYYLDLDPSDYFIS